MKKNQPFIFLVFLLGLGLALCCSGAGAYAQDAENPAAITMMASVLTPISIGDREKLEEDHWISRNTQGGIEEFNYLREYKSGDILEIDARAIGNNSDYALKADYEKSGVGSLKFAFKNFRKYFDGTGGFYPLFTPTPASPSIYFETDRDLHLDIGEIRLEGILAREGEPKYWISYERDYKKGDKSLLSWYTVRDTSGGVQKKIYPSFKDIDEVVNEFKVGVEHTIKNVNVSAEQSWESARAENNYIITLTKTLDTGAITGTSTEYEHYDFDRYTTILRSNKTWADKVYTSLGFMFNRYLGGALDRVVNPSSTNTRPNVPAMVEQNSVVLLPNVSFSLLKDLLLDAGLRFEYLKKSAYVTDFNDRTPGGAIERITDIKAGREEKKIAETLGFKFKGFEHVVLYTDIDTEQRFRDLHESQNSYGSSPGSDFLRITNGDEFDNKFIAGCKWYLLSNLDVATEFRGRWELVHYKHIERSTLAYDDYPAYINGFVARSYTPLLKLNYKPYRWLSTRFGYNMDLTSYGVRTYASDAIEWASYKAHVFSTSLIFTPSDWLYFSLFYSKKNAATQTRANGDGGNKTFVIPTYNGGSDVAGLSFSVAPDAKNTITCGYSMSKSDNFNDFNAATQPLALGLDHMSQDVSLGIEHALRKNLSLQFKYDFVSYKEKSNHGIDNYEAHLIYSAVKMKF